MSERRDNPMATAAVWDAVAAGYDRHTTGFLGMFSDTGLDRLELAADHRVLDVACGPGTTVMRIAPRVAEVTAVDFSAAMLGELARNVREAGIDNVVHREADGQALPFDDATFDVGLSMFGLMFFPDRAAGFAELHRVLKPGGQVLVSSWGPVSRSTAMQALFGAIQAADPSVPDPETDISSLQNPDVFEAELRDAGFVDVRIDEVEHEVEHADTDAYWTSMVEGGAPLKLMQQTLPADEWERRDRAAREFLRERYPTTPIRVGSVAYLGFGRRA